MPQKYAISSNIYEIVCLSLAGACVCLNALPRTGCCTQQQVWGAGACMYAMLVRFVKFFKRRRDSIRRHKHWCARICTGHLQLFLHSA